MPYPPVKSHPPKPGHSAAPILPLPGSEGSSIACDQRAEGDAATTFAPVRADQARTPTLPGESVSLGPGPHRRVFQRLEDLAPLAGDWNPLHAEILETWVQRLEKLTGLPARVAEFNAARVAGLRAGLDAVARGSRPVGLDWPRVYTIADSESSSAVEDLIRSPKHPEFYLERLIRAAALQALLRELGRLSVSPTPAAGGVSSDSAAAGAGSFSRKERS